MYTIKSISAQNFCSFKEFKYAPVQQAATLIFGNNKDNDQQSSNGSGKSALIEAIAFGLTGDTLRKVTADEIINNEANSTMVEIVLYNEQEELGYKIQRSLERKKGQAVRLFSMAVNEIVEEIKLNSVTEYNAAILRYIGISKDNLFNNFILSKHKYCSFLSASDREKKEIINALSGAELIDGAFDKVAEDLENSKESVQKQAIEVARTEGMVSTMTQSIEDEKQRALTAQNDIPRQIEELESKIADRTETIKNFQSQLNGAKILLSDYRDLEADVDDIEMLDSFEKFVNDVEDLLNQYNISWNSGAWIMKSDSCAVRLKRAQGDVATLQKEVQTIKQEQHKAEQALEEYSVWAEQEEKELKQHIEEYTKERVSVIEAMRTLSSIKEDANKQVSQHKEAINRLEAQINGAVQCPKCGEKFLLNSESTYEEVLEQLTGEKNSLSQAESSYKSACTKWDSNNAKSKELGDLMDESDKACKQIVKERKEKQTTVQRISDELFEANSKLNKAQSIVLNHQSTLKQMCQQVFDEVHTLIQRKISDKSRHISDLKNSIYNAEGNVKAWQKQIDDLKNGAGDKTIEDRLAGMNDTLEKYKAQYQEANDKLNQLTLEQNKLTVQKERFVGFKTHLANTKIDALAVMTNNFLEEIGSDIQISLSGFTILKSGKIKDKISVSLLRDGVDCGSYEKFSEGEKARVNLANVLALNELCNIDAAPFGGLDLLILDEILEAVDESGLSSMLEVLGKLKKTCLVVSHGLTSESYPHRLTVNKENGTSYL